MLTQLISLGVLIGVWPEVCDAHGYLWVPPGRSTMWRFGYSTPPNYNDNQLFCGGFDVQWNQNGGQCGICGDNYQDPQPRANEAGGKYGNGILVATYNQGQIITVQAQLTANHKGWMEFRICPNNNVNQIVTQDCLDQHLLQRADGTGTRTPVPTDVLQFVVDLQLPPGLTCSQCVLQWKYHTGNNWDCNDLECCTGCGPRQEEFYACADVEVLGTGVVTTPSPQVTTPPPQATTPPPQVTTPSPQETTPPPQVTTPSAQVTTPSPQVTTPSSQVTTPSPQVTTPSPQVTTPSPEVTTPSPQVTTPSPSVTRLSSLLTTRRPTTTTQAPVPPPTAGPVSNCQAVGVWASVNGLHVWCQQNCPINCPVSHCNDACRQLT